MSNEEEEKTIGICAHQRCQCFVDEDAGVAQSDNVFRCQQCADVRGCEHEMGLGAGEP